MPSLTSCMKKAGEHLRAEDKAAILARAAVLRAGRTSNHEASVQALDERIAEVRAQIEAGANDVPLFSRGKVTPEERARMGNLFGEQEREEADAEAGDFQLGERRAPAAQAQPSERLLLAPQTEDDLRAKAEREAAGERADADEQRRLDDKAKADAQRGDFALTGSDRAADAAPAQRDLTGITDLGEKIGGARKDTAISTGRTGRAASDDDRPAWARRFKVSQIVRAAGQVNAPRDEGRWIIRDSRSTDWTGQPRQVGRDTFATQAEAEAFVPLAAVGLKHRVVPTPGNAKFEIWRDISDRKRVKVVDREFDTRDEALTYMAAHAAEIIEANTTFGEADMPLPPDRARTGPERRKGDVKGEDFMRTFGFRGVEFGNWNNQDERQALMNDAWDGLMDLADVLGVPPRAIGLNGDLALAFGARGHGLNSARAHYERGRAVINLTKERGAGSLAHEWFHALDHYFGRQDGKASATWKVGADGTRTLDIGDPARDYASSGLRGERSGVRPEVREAYEALLRTMTKRAQTYVDDTAKVDQFTGRTREDLARRLDELRRNLSSQLDPTYYKRNNQPASAEQLAEFDSIAKAMLEGEATALATEWRTIAKPGEMEKKASARAAIASRWTNDNLERLSAIYKAVRGRSGFDSTNQEGVLDKLRSAMGLYSQRLKMLAEAQAGTEKVRMVPTEFAREAKELDQGRGEDYWTTPHEMAARAFQGYVEDRIAERGGVSRFLNYGPENVGIPTPWGFKRPFPAGDERKAINGAFDAFLGTLKTREDDAGNVALYSQGRPGRGVDATAVSRIVESIRKTWANAPEVIVVASMQDPAVPEAARRADAAQRSQGAAGDPRGFYFGGKVYLVADGLHSEADVAETLLHESLGHFGLRGTFGDALNPVLDRLAMLNARQVRLKAEEYGLDHTKRTERRIAAEEVLAELAQTRPELGIVQRAIAAIRAWLREHIPALAGRELTDAEIIREYIEPARMFVERGGKGQGAGDVRFARAFHGTPTRGIEKFSTEFVGEGEGAQAYGWGLYFASKKSIAEFYRKSLTHSAPGAYVKGDREISDPADLAEAYFVPGRIVPSYGGRDKVLKFGRDPRFGWFVDVVRVGPNGEARPHERTRRHSTFPDSAKLETALKAEGWTRQEAGQLYEVEVPGDDVLLNWDKPVHEQPEAVKRALQAYIDDLVSPQEQSAFNRSNGQLHSAKTAPLRWSGETLYRHIGEELGSRGQEMPQTDGVPRGWGSVLNTINDRASNDRAASEALAAVGIRGIRYLDAASRKSGDGSHNYVIFSGDDVAIQRVHFSRTEATARAYEARIDALFAGEKANLVGARVLDRSDVLAMLGLGDGPVELAEGKVGRSAHPQMTAEVWKKVPAWLDHPAAVFNSDTVPGRLVFIAAEAVGGAPVMIVVEPKSERGGGATMHLMVNAYNALGGKTPFARWVRDGMLRYVHKAAFPALLANTSGLQLPGTAFTSKPGTKRILSEKNIAGWRRENAPPAGLTDEAAARQQITPAPAAGTAAAERNADQGRDQGAAATLARDGRLLSKGLRQEDQVGGESGDPDIRFSRTPQPATPATPAETTTVERTASGTRETTLRSSPWLDATNRLQFAPGQWLYNAIGRAASPLLTKLQMKAASPEMRAALRRMKLDIAKAQETAAAVAKDMQAFSAGDREMISDIIEREVAAGVAPPEHAVRLAATMSQAMSAQSKELVRLGMLSEEAAQRWDGAYLPRFYESKLKPKVDAWADAVRRITGRAPVMSGIKGNHLKGRGLYETIPFEQLKRWQAMGWEVRDPDYKPEVPPTDGTVQVWRDFTREERERMGEIRDAGFRFVMGYMQTQRDIALGRLFEALANDPRFSSRTPQEGWVRVPDGTVEGTGATKYGKLAGRYVPPDVLSQLTALDEAQSAAWQMYRKALAVWKMGKTSMNPVSHMNNVLSNLSMAHFAGVSYHRADKYFGALRDFITKPAMLQEAKDAGLFLGTMNAEELLKDLPPELRDLATKAESKTLRGARLTFDLLTFFLRKPLGKAYEAEDLFFRYLIYKDARERGMEPQEAVDHAQRFIFTYDDLPKGARMIRDFGIPFFAYTYKAIPALLHTALTHPHRMLAPAAVLWGINALAYAIATDDDDDWQEAIRKYVEDPAFRERVREKQAGERGLLPPWMKGTTALLTPKAIRLGMDEVTELPLFLDVARIIPGGDIFDVSPNAGGVPLPQPITPSHPLFTMAVAMLANKDTWTGKDLVLKDADTSAEAAQKRAEWIWRQVSPAVAIGNAHWERTLNALAQGTGQEVQLIPGAPEAVSKTYTGVNRDGQPVQPKHAAMQTFGIKVRPIDLDLSEKIDASNRQRLIRDIDAQLRTLRRLNSKGAVSDKALDEAIERGGEKKERLREGLTVDGNRRD